MTEHMTAAEFRALPKAKRSKYGAKVTWGCGRCGAFLMAHGADCYLCGSTDMIRFDSRAEAWRWCTLRTNELAGRITKLERQPSYDIITNDILVGRYRPDFRYRDRDGLVVVEDVKSKPTMTTAARLRIKLVEAQYNIKITIVGG